MNEEADMSIFDDLLDEDLEGGAGTNDFVPYNLDNTDDSDPGHQDDDYSMVGMFQPPVDDDDDEEPTETIDEPYSENDLINDVLASKGIVDHVIHYENDEGEIEDVDFYSLPRNEQLAILNSTDRDINYDLEDNEVEAINFLRENGVSFEEAVDYFKREAIEEYINSQNIAGIEIDQYSDEQLFAIDLKAKYEDLTDDEIAIEIEKQLEHPDLFKKKVDKLRTEYKEIEINQLQEARLAQQRDEEQRFNDLQDSLIGVAESVEDIGGLDLDIDDKNEILSYILEKDMNGVSPFIKSLDSPEKLFEIAWYALKGKQAFGIIHDYYKKQIDSVRKTSYDKGREEATKKPESASRKTFVRQNSNQQRSDNIPHIDNLEID